jgi:chemotaxis signal transduction protein
MAATLSTRSLLRVSCSGQWIGIPMEKVDSISSIECHSNKLSKSGELELFPYRGKGIPVVNLNLLLGLETTQSSREHRSFIVIRELMDGIALEVDDFSEFETHVIQDFLEGHFDATPFGGASVMGDGAICLMLSIDKVLQRSKLSKMDYVGGDSPVALQSSIRKAEDSCVLVFQPSEGALFCSVDMGWVSRIETFNAEQLKILKGKKIYSCNMGLLQYFELSDFGLGDMVSSIESISTVLMIKLENRTIALGIYKIEDMYTGPIRWLGRLQLPMIQNSWSYSDQLVGNINLKELSAQFQPSKHLLVGAES